MCESDTPDDTGTDPTVVDDTEVTKRTSTGSSVGGRKRNKKRPTNTYSGNSPIVCSEKWRRRDGARGKGESFISCTS